MPGIGLDAWETVMSKVDKVPALLAPYPTVQMRKPMLNAVPWFATAHECGGGIWVYP
jgi:hypothetical protein